ncbi:hypothetical protein LIER_16869 [Lithospermum erythrorhizon]|uniref:Reverse transcriptase zinc-binding domain-containing protein n=1 Tax=Lithospermum erythrorhizon TaxID=34254 RepID=A0AAV3Q899_LITER
MKLNSNLGGKGMGGSNHGDSNDLCWKSVWPLKVPPRIKICLWKACHNILPTKDRLRRRGIMVESSCKFCKEDRETLVHISVSCSYTNKFWFASPWCLSTGVREWSSFKEWWMSITATLKIQD